MRFHLDGKCLKWIHQDLQNGFINVPKEYIELYGIDLSQIDSAAFRAWVRERTAKAREYFMKGKHLVF